MTVSDTWKDWKTDPSLDVPPSTATPEIDKELRNIKAQVKGNVIPALYAANYTSLTTILTALGTTNPGETVIDAQISVPAGATLTIPDNVSIRVIRGGYFDVANTGALVIQGPIEAGPYKIFAWSGTGSIDISSSPVEKPFLNWWGAVPDPVAGSGAECSAIVQKAFAGMGHHQTLKLSQGWYTVNHFSLTDAAMMYNIEGSGKVGYYAVPGDGFWITGNTSTDGIVFGQAATAMQAVKLRNFSIGGPASCCKNGVVVYMSALTVENVNLWMGASDYGMLVQGCIINDIKVSSYHQDALNEAGPAGVLELTYDPATAWACNATNVDIRCNQTGGSFSKTPLYIKGLRTVSGNQPAGTVMNITGVIDQVDATNAVHIVNGVLINIDHLYCETTSNILIESCESINIIGLLNTQGRLILSNSYNVTVNGYNLYGITILPDCSGVVIGPGSFLLSAQLLNYAGDTIFLNGPNTNPIYSIDSSNFIYNTDLSRWNTADGVADGGWYKFGTSTWTQCTGTQGDGTTAPPGCTYYAKVVMTSPAAGQTYNLDSAVIPKFLGKTLSFSYWQNYPAGQTFTNWYELLASVSFSIPIRANSTAYNIGDAVTVSGTGYLCVAVTGDQKSAASAPTFDTNGGTTTDGNVTWRSFYWLTTASYYDNPPTTSDGVWRHVTVSQYIPTNATTIAVGIGQPIQTGGTDSTMYFGGPAIMLGRQTQRSQIPNNPLRKEVGSLVVWETAPAAGTWLQVGDLDLTNHAWCSTAGKQGSTAAWTGF